MMSYCNDNVILLGMVVISSLCCILVPCFFIKSNQFFCCNFWEFWKLSCISVEISIAGMILLICMSWAFFLFFLCYQTEITFIYRVFFSRDEIIVFFFPNYIFNIFFYMPSYILITQGVMFVKIFIFSGVVRRTFYRWKVAKDEAIIRRLKYEQAVQHHEFSIMITAFRQWQKFKYSSQRKRVTLIY